MINPNPCDSDMWRASNVLLQEIESAETWVHIMRGIEALAAVRAQYNSMESERMLHNNQEQLEKMMASNEEEA